MALHGPATILRADDYATYQQRHAAFARDRKEVPTARGDSITVYANEGRWLADCPYCNAGMTTQQDWPDIRCFGCSGIYATVVWPDAETAKDIEAELLMRPMKFQNWIPGESVAQLARENLDHRLISPFVAEQLAAVAESEG